MRENNNNSSHITQRALVLQGGGALGAYEAGALKILCKHLVDKDKENGEEGRLLFDVVAGTSIGAMNGAILVSQFLESQSWEKAVEEVEKFWNDKEKGLASDIDINKSPQDMNRWQKDEQWYNQSVKGVASTEAARRYNSAKYFFINGAPKMFTLMPSRPDFKFFDPVNEWKVFYSNESLKNTILNFAKFPIITDFHENHPKPRLLIFSVDAAEGEVVMFDSYPKLDGSRRSEYGEYEKNRGYPHVIKYPGIMIEHVMASGTIPELYDYAKVPMDQTDEQKNQKAMTITHGDDKNKLRKFWDGGILNNTPFRELLQAHQEYWNHVKKNDKTPDLEVYIINVHPSKIDVDMIPIDYDGVKDRHNDIKYCDRSSRYDEKTLNLITDYTNFASRMKDLVEEIIDEVSDKNKKDKLLKKYEDVLSTKTISEDREHEEREYKDLIKVGFKLTKVVRIEHTNYINSIYGKTADLTLKTINKLIKEGECDAWVSLIEDSVKCTKIPFSVRHLQDNLTSILKQVTVNLKSNDYENNTIVFDELTKFIDEVKKNQQSIDELKPGQSVKLIELVAAFKSSL